MAKVRLLNGKPLMVGGKVALSDDCCCGTTPQICDSDCGHQIKFSVKFDQSEIDFDFSELATFNNGSQNMFIEADSGGWYFTGLGLFLTVDAVDVPRVADVWYLVDLCITSEAGVVTVRFCVENTCVDDTSTDCHLGGWNRLRIGDEFGDVVHRSYKEIAVLSNFEAETNFNFPADSFDSLVGNASVISESGTTVLRIDDDDENPAYGQIDFDNAWSLNCCCGRDCDEISTIRLDFSGSVTGSAVGCSVSDSRSGTGTWNRIDKDDTFDGSNQFKLYFGNDCNLNLEINPPTSFCFTTGFEISASIFDCPSGCIAANGALVGFWCADSLIAINNSSPPCGSGTIDVPGVSRLTASCTLCATPPCTDCETVICASDSGFQGDTHSGIPFTCDDVSALLGSYSFNSSGTEYSLSMTVAIG